MLTYSNPILYADYSDPDVIRVGEDFYLVASSFTNTPALPILHSTDLVHWEILSYALENLPFPRYDKVQHGCGVWAPAIRYHEGTFYLLFPMPDEGIFMTKATDPAGVWSEPVTVAAVPGWIDPCPFWDEDGRVYMVHAFAKSRIGFNAKLQIVELKPDLTGLLGEPRIVFDGNVCDQPTIEGPKLYSREGYYYIFAPAGGVKQGWQTVLRAKDIFGPYEFREVLSQQDTAVNGPHQGAWVDTEAGDDWFVHFQDVYAAGRILHLQPMHWERDGWPVLGDEGRPVSQMLLPLGESTEHMPDRHSFGLQWQWNANHGKDWLVSNEGEERITLRAVRSEPFLCDQPNLYLQKWDAPEFLWQVKLDSSGLNEGDEAGIVSLGMTYGALSIEQTGDGLRLIARQGSQHFTGEIPVNEEKICGQWTMDPTEVVGFRIRVERESSTEQNTEGRYAFPIPRERITLSFSEDGVRYTEALSYVAEAGRWVGVKYGIFCRSRRETSTGTADFFFHRALRDSGTGFPACNGR